MQGQVTILPHSYYLPTKIITRGLKNGGYSWQMTIYSPIHHYSVFRTGEKKLLQGLILLEQLVQYGCPRVNFCLFYLHFLINPVRDYMWVTNKINENVPSRTGRNNIRVLIISTQIKCLTAQINPHLSILPV